MTECVAGSLCRPDHHLPPCPPIVDAMVDTSGQDQEERIFSFEEALAKIKDTTGVSDIQEVVDRFLNQVGPAMVGVAQVT